MRKHHLLRDLQIGNSFAVFSSIRQKALLRAMSYFATDLFKLNASMGVQLKDSSRFPELSFFTSQPPFLSSPAFISVHLLINHYRKPPCTGA